MNARSRLARAAAAIVIAGSVLLGTSACGFFTPIATLQTYDPTDGINADVGSLALRNVVGVMGEDGKAISLMVTVINSDSNGRKVNFQFESGGEKTTVDQYIGGRETVSFGTEPGGEQIVVLFPSVPAGGLLPVYVQYGDQPGEQLLVPVLDARGIYAELAPPAILR